MDSDQFDRIARVLTARRGLLGGLLASTAAVMSRFRAVDEAAAHNPLPACRKIKHKQRRARCIRKAKQHNAAHAAPPPDQCLGRNVCSQSGAAACGTPGNECYCWVSAAGTPICGGNEEAISAPDCTACTQMGRICVQGGGTFCDGPVVCVLPCCPPGYRECNGRCVDVLRDPDHCGDCGRSCGIDRPNVCAGGSCCIDAGGTSPCSCAPAGSACAPVGNACCAGGATCTNGVCP